MQSRLTVSHHRPHVLHNCMKLQYLLSCVSDQNIEINLEQVLTMNITKSKRGAATLLSKVSDELPDDWTKPLDTAPL